MNEHHSNSGTPEPIDELEPIDLDALFDGDLDDDADSDLDPADAVTDDDATLVARLFAADLADEPATSRSTADIVAAARAAADSAAAENQADTKSDRAAERATDSAAERATDSAAPGDRSAGAAAAPQDLPTTDELTARRRRRTFISRGLLAAAAVAVLGVGGVAVIRSLDGGATGTASVATMADGPAYAPARTQAAPGAASSSAASAPDAGSTLESSRASAAASAAPAPSASAAAGSSTSGHGATAESDASASEAPARPTVTVTVPGSGRTPVTRTGTQVTEGGCPVSGLPRAATAAAAAAVGGQSLNVVLFAARSAGICQDSELAGQVFTTTDGSRVTVLVAREVGVEGPELSAGSSSGAAQRSAVVGSGQVRVQVLTPAGSSVTDRQLQQAAAAVLATQR